MKSLTSRRLWSVAVLATLSMVVTAAPAGATHPASPLTTVQSSPVAAALDTAGHLNVIRTRGDGVILRDQMATPGSHFLGWQASSGPSLQAVAAESDLFVAVEAGIDALGNVYVSRQTNGGSTQWTAWEQLTGLALTSIALARNADGRLELIGTNFAGAVVHSTQVAAGSVGNVGGWGTLFWLEGPTMQSVAAETNTDGRVVMVGIGLSGAAAGLPFFRAQVALNSTSWTQWAPLPGGPLPGGAQLTSIAVARSNDSKLKVFGIDNAGRLLMIREATFDATTWDPSWFVENDGHGGAIAAQGDANSTIHLFGRDGAGTLSYRSGSIDDVYGSWRPLNQYRPTIDFTMPTFTLVLLRPEWPGHFQGSNGRSDSELRQMINSDQWWPEVSYGHRRDFTVSTLNQTVAIAPPPASLAPCTPEFFQAIANAVDPIAASRGHDPELYHNVLYYLPHLTGGLCDSIAGEAASVGGKRAYVNGDPTNKVADTGTILHELGHTMGLDHASARNCTNAGVPVTLSTTCTEAEYGDPNSVMGNRNNGGIAASQRAWMGWLKPDQITSVVDASGFGTHTISPIELTTIEPGHSNFRALNFVDNGIVFWVELRQQVGVDTNEVANPGVYIYQEIAFDAQHAEHSYLLDMTPGSNTGDTAHGSDHLDASLAVGHTWINPLGHLKITVNSANSAGADITVVPA